MDYQTMGEIVEANEKIGHHFFEPETMELFDSRIEAGPFSGRFFVTSEQLHTDRLIANMPMVFAMLGATSTDDDAARVGPREYQVRMVRDDGSIESRDKYESKIEAILAAEGASV